ncbi:GspE/PulE family protein [Deinococcus aluminii]|uniref:Bacterial type II secretion system protein E domain-containing protein n=1 Tax=Deinococcus aluminii TaxID=1656885 RepID=A0ABP9XH45_9DEIO
MKKQTFGDHVRTEGKLGIIQVGRLRVPGHLQKQPQREQDAYVLERARSFLPEDTIERALQKSGVRRADHATKVIDAGRGIVEAKAGEATVRASSNPFQEDGLLYLPPDALVIAPPPIRPQEPAWIAPPSQQGEEEYRPPVDLAALAAEVPAPVQPDPSHEVEAPRGPDTPLSPATVPQAAVPALADPTEAPLPGEQTGMTLTPPLDVPAPLPQTATLLAPSSPPAQAASPVPATPEPAPAPTPETGGPTSLTSAPEVRPTPSVPPKEQVTPPPTPAPLTAPDPLRGQADPTPAAPRPFPKRERARRMTTGEALMQLGYGDVQTSELSDPRLEQTLVKSGRINEEQAFRALALARDLTFVDADTDPPRPEIAHLLDEHTCTTNRVFPYRLEDGTFYVLTDMPQREMVIRTTVSERSGQPHVELLLTTSTVLEQLIRDAYTAHTTLRDLAQEIQEGGAPTPEVDLDGDDNAVKRFVRDIITAGVSRGASDIHFEPTDAGLRVRYRIDKRLRLATTDTVNKNGMGNVIRVLKLMAHMDVGNNREPQDNRITLRLGTRRINLRASSMPLSEGHEKIVLRILRDAGDIPEIEGLHMHPRTLDRFRQLIGQPDGMVLVTGPTGSGKSFTLYSALKRIASEENNVQTLEDPIEYQLPGINQAQMNDLSGYTFARALRTAMRQDPDVILVGEIRDEETARVAIAAANTGHLLLSTLHTNDAPSAVQRLRNIGVEDYNIAPALRGVLAQRLVPRVCPHCSTEAPLPEHVRGALRDARLPVDGTARRANPEGCSRCERGRRGLIPVHELLVIDAHQRDLISGHASTDDVRAAALRSGMLDLITDGYVKAAQGLVDVDDLESVVNSDLDLTPAHA